MPVRHLELENFKSYAGLQHIGPFTDFTSVIGPNGSGKSNLMDAVSFVLGVHSKDLRSQQLRDLIYRAPGTSASTASSKSSLKCSATLVYETEESPSEERRFTRTISGSGTSHYLVDGRSMSRADYEQQLADIGVLVKARNFLVFQGDVENLARKSPQELVDLLEQISGSADYKADYEAAVTAKEEAEAARLFCSKQKKTLEHERHLLKEQKEEAERFHALLDQKAALQTDLYLWQLFHLDQDRLEREQAAQELHTQLEELTETEQEAASVLKQAKKAASASRRQTAAADKARVAAAAAVDTTEPAVIEITEECKNWQKKIKADETALTKKRAEAENHDAKVEQLEQEIAEYQQSEASLVKEYEETKTKLLQELGGDGTAVVHLTAEQEAEYERVREAAAAAGAEPRRILSQARRKLESARATATAKETQLQEAKATQSQLERDVQEGTDRSATLTQHLEKTATDLETTERELKELQDSHRQAQARREELDVELEKIYTQLRDAKNARRQNKDEERLLAAIQTLRSNFPGVHGRLVDLCRPTQRKYSHAVTVAAGKDMDAIVVDTRATATECIKYLRENRVGVATFVPLDHVQVPPQETTESLRAHLNDNNQNRTRYRLAVDVISVADPAMKKAVQYAVGNTVVADTLDDARELCFGRSGGGGGRGRHHQQQQQQQQSRIKAVTLQGAVISKAGTMTGGVTRDDDGGAGRWNNQEIEKLRELKEQKEAERAELDQTETGGRGGRRSGRSGKIEELRNNLGSLKNKDKYSKSELEYTKKQLKEKKTRLQSTSKEVAKLEKQVKAAEKEFEKADAAVKKAVDDVKAAEDEHLAPFREATGLRDLKAYEDAMGKIRDDFNEKKRAVVEHITSLEQQKEYEVGRDLKQPIARIEKRIKERKASLKKAQKRSKDLEGKVDEAKEKLGKAEEALKEATEKEKEFEEEVQSAQASYKEAQNASAQLKKQISAEEAALERLRGKLHETLQKARVEKVELPLVGANREPGALGRTRSRRSRRGTQDEDDEEEAEDSQEMSQESESMSQTMTSESRTRTQFSQAENPVVMRDQQQASKVDFSRMREDLKRRLSDREEKKMRKEFEDKLSKIVADIESITPNMKANEAFSAATQRLKDSKTSHEEAKVNATKAAQAFQKIKAKRSKCFLEAYNHIEGALKTIYTDMTKSSKHPLGGNAYLSLDDAEEPYKGGLKFNAMPPMKRFRDMEQLSGGEKTVAALSLLFAIHSFHPAPFFVMDEVDAALDNINLRKVCNYISQRSKTDFQCIVISLKDMFYEHSQSLVGICRDVATNSSNTLTLDLTKFDTPQMQQQPTSSAKRGRSSSKRPRESEATYKSKKRASLSLGRSSSSKATAE